jgi:hypothetical protein
MKNILTLLTAFVLFSFSFFTLSSCSSCKACDKNEAKPAGRDGNTNNTSLDITTSNGTIGADSEAPNGSNTTGSSGGLNSGEGEDIPALVPLTPVQFEAKTKQKKIEVVRDKIMEKLQVAQVEVKKMIENGATKASAKKAKNKVSCLYVEAEQLLDDEIMLEDWSNDAIKEKVAEGDVVVLNAIEAQMAAISEASMRVGAIEIIKKAALMCWWEWKNPTIGDRKETRKLKRKNTMKAVWLNMAQVLETQEAAQCFNDIFAEALAAPTLVEGERRIHMAMYNSAKRVIEEQVAKMREMAAEI